MLRVLKFFLFAPFTLSLSLHFFKFECISPELKHQTITQAFTAPIACLSEGQLHPMTYSRPHTISLPWQLWLISLATLQGQLHKKGTCSHCTVSHKGMLLKNQLLILSRVWTNSDLLRIDKQQIRTLLLIYGHMVSEIRQWLLMAHNIFKNSLHHILLRNDRDVTTILTNNFSTN